jgi:hypothetical protein
VGVEGLTFVGVSQTKTAAGGTGDDANALLRKYVHGSHLALVTWQESSAFSAVLGNSIPFCENTI